MNQSQSVSQSQLKLPNHIIEANGANFQKKFNRSPFMFSHNLAGHPLFEIPRLCKLANTMKEIGRQDYVLCMSNNGSASRTFSEAIQTFAEPNQNVLTSEVIAQIAQSGSLIFLKSVHVDPEYKELLNRVLIELEDLTGVPLHQEITWSIATIIISSPYSVTPYHIDHDSNFLFQIHGDKEVHLFNQNDRSVLTEQEIEQFYIGEIESTIYREENEDQAKVFHLTPNTGVHHPVLAPHLVKTGDKVSVSLSINFCLRSFDRQGKIYQINHCLRKLKLKPTPPGQSVIKDKLKIAILEVFSKRNPESHSEVVWSGISNLMAPMKLGKKLKQLPVSLISKIPIVSDYYHYYWIFPKQMTACRGVFKTFSEAIQALPLGTPTSHSQPEIHTQSELLYLSTSRELGKLYSYDYPLIPYLKLAFLDSSTIFDFGGNVGVSYYAFKKHLCYPDNLHWIVCELPELIKAGQKIAGETDSQGLSFTSEFLEADGADILLTCGTLQYIEPSLSELLNQLNKKPKHILISMTPLYDGESYVTLQNLGYAFSPYKIQNRAKFVASLTSLGYKLIDSWKWDRTLSIPFHRKRFVSAYHGFYFRHSSL